MLLRAANCSSLKAENRSTAIRDQVNIAELRTLGVPFWLAGGYGSPEKVREALDQGAAGVQVGTAFAFSRESGLRDDLKKSLMAKAATGTGEVFTDPLASPTGYPFKVALLDGSYSDPEVTKARTRICDLGYMREPYNAPDGNIGYRCAAEPVANYVAKGGKVEETVGRKCLCNALLANIGHAQRRKNDVVEPASGDHWRRSEYSDAVSGAGARQLQRRRRGCIAAEQGGR